MAIQSHWPLTRSEILQRSGFAAKSVSFAALFAALFTLGDFLSFYNLQIVTAFMVVCMGYCGARILFSATLIYSLIDVLFGLGMYWGLVLNWQAAAVTVFCILALRPKAYGLAAGAAFLSFTVVDAFVAAALLDIPFFAYLMAGIAFAVRGVLSGVVIGEVLMRVLRKRTKLHEILD